MFIQFDEMLIDFISDVHISNININIRNVDLIQIISYGIDY